MGPEPRLTLKEICEKEGLLSELENGFKSVRPKLQSQPKIVPFASGSAVIASKEKLAKVQDQHRNVAGIDMELFGIYLAVKLSGNSQMEFFGVKTVVDMADKSKNDELHEYGCMVSARITALAISALLPSSL